MNPRHFSAVAFAVAVAVLVTAPTPTAQNAPAKITLADAQKIIDAAVDMAPDQAEAWDLRAKINFLKKDYDAAIADLKRALDRDPRHYDAMSDLGVVYEAMGSKKEALEAYRKALALNPYLSEPKRAVEELRREIDGQDI